jgi:catechol-2,3-dioxygenase
MKPMGKASERMAFLTDEQGMILSMFSAPEVHYPGTFHIGFGQDTPEKVDEINRRLRADGYDVEAPSRQHGSWTFYFKAPGGFTVEVLC